MAYYSSDCTFHLISIMILYTFVYTAPMFISFDKKIESLLGLRNLFCVEIFREAIRFIESVH